MTTRPSCHRPDCDQPRVPHRRLCRDHLTDYLDRATRTVHQYVTAAKAPGCRACGYNTHPAALDWHHLDPTTKSFNLSQAPRHQIGKVKRELAKCILLCANCHRLHHAGALDVHHLPLGP